MAASRLLGADPLVVEVVGDERVGELPVDHDHEREGEAVEAGRGRAGSHQGHVRGAGEAELCKRERWAYITGSVGLNGQK